VSILVKLAAIAVHVVDERIIVRGDEHSFVPNVDEAGHCRTGKTTDQSVSNNVDRTEKCNVHQSTGSIGGILDNVVDVFDRLRFSFNLDVSSLVDIQIFLQFESLATVGVVANPLFILGVSLLVTLQGAFLDEFFATNIALERAFTSVCANMAGQRPPRAELLQATRESAVKDLISLIGFLSFSRLVTHVVRNNGRRTGRVNEAFGHIHTRTVHRRNALRKRPHSSGIRHLQNGFKVGALAFE
jgi:hypothetical protein